VGVFRKFTSISTMGLVDFRSDKERIARSTRQSAHELRKQTQLMESAAADRQVGARTVNYALPEVQAQLIEHNRRAMIEGRPTSARARRDVLADDVRQGVHNSYPATSEPQPADRSPVPIGQSTLVDQLARLAELRSQGAITDDEFVAAKARLLGG
jgi:hypothetical protein